MTGRRMGYGAVWIACALFYILYKQWFSWLLLVGVSLLPFLSLLLSLPAMVTVQAMLSCPERVRQGVQAKTRLDLSCRFPIPPAACRIRLENKLTGQRYVGEPGEYVPTDHCGCMEISCKKLWVCDYLGLFRHRVKMASRKVYILPRPLPTPDPSTQDQRDCHWVPKNGGGFGENHDLRLYRPGDDLRQIHWKMTAKTGKLIYREPLVPTQQAMQVVMTLSGSPQELDRKLGRLTFLNRTLMEQSRSYDLRVRTESAEQAWRIDCRKDFEQTLDTLLESRPTTGEWTPRKTPWQYRIGGEPDEA